MGLAGWQGGRGGLLVLCPLFREGLAYRSGSFNRREMPKIDGKGEGQGEQAGGGGTVLGYLGNRP